MKAFDKLKKLNNTSFKTLLKIEPDPLTRNKKLKLKDKLTSIDIKYFYIKRIMDHWNKLPAGVMTTETRHL